MAWMYILQCGDGTYYVGSIKSLSQRIYQHQQGLGATYTSRRLPVKLVYCEEYDRFTDAYAREKQIQGWSRAKRKALIRGDNQSLPELSKKAFKKKTIIPTK